MKSVAVGMTIIAGLLVLGVLAALLLYEAAEWQEKPRRRRDGRASVRRMRRWGMRRRTILKCLLGFHGRTWRGRCGRCGRFRS